MSYHFRCQSLYKDTIQKWSKTSESSCLHHMRKENQCQTCIQKACNSPSFNSFQPRGQTKITCMRTHTYTQLFFNSALLLHSKREGNENLVTEPHHTIRATLVFKIPPGLVKVHRHCLHYHHPDPEGGKKVKEHHVTLISSPLSLDYLPFQEHHHPFQLHPSAASAKKK